jgi:hypothetical protein
LIFFFPILIIGSIAITKPFLNFKPFSRSGGGDNYGQSDRFGGYPGFSPRDNRRKRPLGRPPSNTSLRTNRDGGVSINLGSGDDSYGDLESQKREKVTPKRDVIEKAISRLKK